MLFDATFSRADKRLPVSGNVHQDDGGQWRGQFSFPAADLPAITTGEAMLIFDGDRIWEIFVLDSHCTSRSRRGKAAFQIIKVLP